MILQKVCILVKDCQVTSLPFSTFSSVLAMSQNLSWKSEGITLINKDIILNGIAQTLGIVISLTYDLDDNLYLVEKSHHRILIFNKMNLSIRVGHLNASSNSNKYSLNSPNDCLVDADHRLYVADTMNHRVQLFERNSMEGITILGTGLFSLHSSN